MQIYLLDASIPDAEPVLVEKRRSGIEYYVEHHQGLLYILTNACGGANYNLMSAPSHTPGLRYIVCSVYTYNTANAMAVTVSRAVKSPLWLCNTLDW